MKVSVLLILFIALVSCNKSKNKNEVQAIDNMNEVSLNVVDYYGLEKILERKDNKTYVVNFWATWCAPCVKELPYFEKLGKDYKTKNVAVVLVSLDFPKKYESQLKPFIKKHQLKSELVVLNDMNSNFWIPKVSEDWSGAIPATLIFNKDKRQFYEKAFQYKELESEIQKYIY